MGSRDRFTVRRALAAASILLPGIGGMLLAGRVAVDAQPLPIQSTPTTTATETEMSKSPSPTPTEASPGPSPSPSPTVSPKRTPSPSPSPSRRKRASQSPTPAPSPTPSPSATAPALVADPGPSALDEAAGRVAVGIALVAGLSAAGIAVWRLLIAPR